MYIIINICYCRTATLKRVAVLIRVAEALPKGGGCWEDF